MRNLLLLLILANILYFLYGALRGDDPKPGVDIVREEQLGPKLEIANATVDDSEIDVLPGDAGQGLLEQPADDSGDRDDDASGQSGDAPPMADSTDKPDESDGGDTLVDDEPVELAGMTLTAVVGRSCVTVGPFRELEDAERAQMRYAGEGMRSTVRTTTGEIFVGHWVQIRNIASREEANTMLDKLKAEGLGESYLISTEDEGLKISIGLFGDAGGAERVELQVLSIGLPAEIVPRMNEGTVHYADIALPPGKGASGIIEQYGEDKVALRESATCPENT